MRYLNKDLERLKKEKLKILRLKAIKSLKNFKITRYLNQMCILVTLIDSEIVFEKFLKLGKIWPKNG